jgi:hypothetical protein
MLDLAGIRNTLLALGGLLGLTVAIGTSSVFADDSLKSTAADPANVVGDAACVKCHAAEVKSHQSTPHVRTFDELHRRPEAASIAAKLNLQSIKHDGRCVSCHYTQQLDIDSGKPHVIAGVSCESCHGAAKSWLELHADYGGPQVTRLTETPVHREVRIKRSIAMGMRNPANVFLVAQSCYRCHTTADEQLVNVGGHSVGSLEFEFVSWSQGTQRHNFVRTDGKSNAQNTPERLRVMFVAGMIAELEATLRATALATEKATFGLNAAQRAARAAARLKSVQQKVGIPEVEQSLATFGTVTLKLNQRVELAAAADEIARFGYEFAEKNDGTALAALDPFIPEPTRWK